MSLWWAKKNQLDPDQIDLIENLPSNVNHLVKGPPGSGKTNVLLRRAQLLRAEGMPRVLVLSFTRPLVEFVKTGCFNSSGSEIFPVSLVETVEGWFRWLHSEHGEALPKPVNGKDSLSIWKRSLAESAGRLASRQHIPQFDTIFVDESQDLLREELDALQKWSRTLFFVGDSKQQIYGNSVGLDEVLKTVTTENVHTLPAHYRIAPEIARVADQILQSSDNKKLESSGFYKGPAPGKFDPHGPLSKDDQLELCKAIIKDQLRLYGDFIAQGDRIGIVVALTEDREWILREFEDDEDLRGLAKIIRSRTGERGDDYEVGFDGSPISIVTVQGCKGLEFRTVHWLVCEQNAWAHSSEHYYTVVTRAKTEIDVYYTKKLPTVLASAHSNTSDNLWD